MRVHITSLHGHASISTAQNAQQMIASVARDMGFNELSIYAYPVSVDSESELSKRLDGIVAGISHQDIVFVQFPTWNGMEFDKKLIYKLKLYNRLKLIIFVHDVIPLMFDGNYYLMDETIELFNLADALILPTAKMYERLKEAGLKNERVIFQQIWDFTHHLTLNKPSFKKIVHFAGQARKFEFCNNWHLDYVLRLYGSDAELKEGVNVQFRGWHNRDQLLLALSEGGFGLVWSENNFWSQYMTMNVSYKISTYLSAGIPIIARKGISNQQLIEENGLGIIVDSLEELNHVLSEMTEQRYQELVTNVEQFSYLLQNGYFTKKIFVDAIHAVQKK
ncbi:sugar transferase [Carnobacteriaceae bacterium zg-84]|uniref:sugar transferase n=1 Tax=Granulicatella sp. zg-84 TaxID=2678503 RepID=UPI0013C12414|nr:sugar transferase [Granulicatella sp. zg-84]NEW65575.1 nucleotide sugar synthetase [Granulicatella sp. zg-84]QMI85545.1 sugar transferase [Carnobacteriaceae bacterium zg-84]